MGFPLAAAGAAIFPNHRASVVINSAEIQRGEKEMPAIEIADMMRVLRIERSHTRKELRNLDRAIVVLRGLSTNSTPRNGRRRKMSASARRKIAKAQRLRWADGAAAKN